MLFRKIKFLSSTLLVFAFFFILSCTSKDNDVQNINIGIATWAGFGTGIVGMEKGYFDNINVNTRILDVSSARQAAFISGSLDIMISSVDLYAQEAAQNITGKAFLVTDESFGGDGIVVSDDIKTISDLKGKKVAFNRVGPSDYLLYKALSKEGLTLDDIIQVEVDDPSKAGDAFLGGSVDAAVTWEPFLSQVVDTKKGHILLTTKDFPNIIVDILVANDKLAKDEELLHRFMDGWLKAVDFIKKNPKESAEIMSKTMNLPAEDVEGMMAGLKYADSERNKYFFDSENVSDTKISGIFDDASAYWLKLDIIKKSSLTKDRISKSASLYFNSTN